MFSVPVWILYLLTIVFLGLSVFFLAGKGTELFVCRDTIRGGRFDNVRLGRALGLCFLALALLLGGTSLFRNCLPEWYRYLFLGVVAVVIFSAVVICNMNMIFKSY